MSKRLDGDMLLTKLKNIHANKYSYPNFTYKNKRTKICIICKEHGKFYQLPIAHLNGRGCPKCAITSKRRKDNDVLADFKKVHGELYDYSSFKYRGATVQVTIICKEHGEFLQTPTTHIRGSGCPKCANSKKRVKVDDLIKDFNLIHNNKYTYTNIVYKNNKDILDIICPTHGVFKQSANYHKRGFGCPKCKCNTKGWGYTTWENAGKVSSNFDGYKLYVLKCYNTEETFFKIGKTFTKLTTRFSSTRSLPYTYEVLLVIRGSARYVSELEHKLHKLNKKHKYIPKIKFNGMYECFNKIEKESYEF